ncbi:MAG: energy transducer TonB [Alistipes sp.]|nr:energy transducer TonB [Alistipes sp.]
MEPKKSPKADLQRKRGLFFEIGLACTLLSMIGVFAISQTEKHIDTIDMKIQEVETEIVEITRQDQKPPEPVAQTVAVVSDVLNIVKNDTKITTELTFADFDEDIQIAKPVERVETATVSDEPFIIVEDMPIFQGGDLQTFRNWVQSKLTYPAIAAENGIQGKVVLTFVIERDGTLTNIQVLSSPDRSLSEEAEKVLKQSPKWAPGKQRNTPVRVRFNLPVDFQLN